MFNKFDKVVKSNILLNNPKINISIDNIKEIFDEFFARFT